MDSLIAAAARALAAGDALGALNRVALRNDPPALALRGIAMAQLGEYSRARDLLRRAGRSFGASEGLARARCVVADAEVALAMRDFGGSSRSLESAAAALEKQADRANALQARLILARRELLLGRLDVAARLLKPLDLNGIPPPLVAIAELARAELALRSRQMAPARLALANAREAAQRAGIAALTAEVAEVSAVLERPAARRLSVAGEQALRLDEVVLLLEDGSFVLDACRRGVRAEGQWISLARRPVLFALARALAEGCPQEVDRSVLMARAFGIRRPNETHRVRLRVEIGRLRTLLGDAADIVASPRGFVLKPRRRQDIVVLAPPVDGEQGSLLALLSDGAAWSTSALALALGRSQRSVQRALLELETTGKVRSIERSRARRWLSLPLTAFTTILLLPATLAFE
jgi:hypothetical protein